MLKNLPPYLKPFLPVFAAMGTMMLLDFGALLVTEWLDGNYWSFFIRCAGLITTVVIGFWVRRAFKQFKTGLEEEHKKYDIPIDDPSSFDAYPPENPCAAGRAGYQGVMRPRCSAIAADGRACGCLAEIRVNDQTGYCVWCYVETVESRFAAVVVHAAG